MSISIATGRAFYGRRGDPQAGIRPETFQGPVPECLRPTGPAREPRTYAFPRRAPAPPAGPSNGEEKEAQAALSLDESSVSSKPAEPAPDVKQAAPPRDPFWRTRGLPRVTGHRHLSLDGVLVDPWMKDRPEEEVTDVHVP